MYDVWSKACGALQSAVVPSISWFVGMLGVWPDRDCGKSWKTIRPRGIKATGMNPNTTKPMAILWIVQGRVSKSRASYPSHFYTQVIYTDSLINSFTINASNLLHFYLSLKHNLSALFWRKTKCLKGFPGWGKIGPYNRVAGRTTMQNDMLRVPFTWY